LVEAGPKSVHLFASSSPFTGVRALRTLGKRFEKQLTQLSPIC
jgi:HPt (histidine-containing phosphotransfer) domain-containing protein